MTSLSRKIKQQVRSIIKIARNLIRFSSWIMPALVRNSLVSGKENDRILLIYDTTHQPFSIGDFLVIQEASLALTRKFSAKYADIAVVYDARRPAKADKVFEGVVSTDNVLLHLASMMPVLNLNPKIGSLFVFNSKTALENYLAKNIDEYLNIWPSCFDYGSGKYLNLYAFNTVLYDFFKKYADIPSLSSSAPLKSWALSFIHKNIYPKVPITINIRNNPMWDSRRNSRILEWVKFFRYAEKSYPDVIFIVICAKKEISEEFRGLSNVIFAKDFSTELDQELALIEVSAAHLGTNSGPAAMAYFNKNPYFIFSLPIDGIHHEHFEKKDMLVHVRGDIFKFWFASDLQKFSSQPENIESLVSVFEEIYLSIDLKGWQISHPANFSIPMDRHSWMR
jgi:hypothetical protein